MPGSRNSDVAGETGIVSKPKPNTTYVLEDGDSIDYLAFATGHFWKTIWGDPDNATLAEGRSHHNEVETGESVHIPALRVKTESRQTDLVHRFKRKGVPFELVYVVRTASGEILADCAYLLKVGSRRYEGKTDAQGSLRCMVVPTARQGELFVEPDKEGYPKSVRFVLAIGPTPPPKTIRGMQHRLTALGYRPGPVDGKKSDATTTAARLFKADQEMEVDDTMDDALADAIDQAYGALVAGR